MRSLLLGLVPVVLAFHLIACTNDEEQPSEPQHDVVQNPLIGAGGTCDLNSECESNVCVHPVTSSIGTRGLPAPEPVPCGQGNDCTPKGKPDPIPAPSPGGAPIPTPAPAPAPAPEYVPGLCAAKA